MNNIHHIGNNIGVKRIDVIGENKNVAAGIYRSFNGFFKPEMFGYGFHSSTTGAKFMFIPISESVLAIRPA